METNLNSTTATKKPSAKEIKALVNSYLAEQPESTRTFHRWMDILEKISLGILILVFITALVLSFLWKSIPAQAIPTAWFLLPVSGTILLLLISIHGLGLGVFPPSSLFIVLQKGTAIPFSEKSRAFRTGKDATRLAWGLIVLAVVAGAFFGVFAWAAWTVNWDVLTPLITILGTALGVTMAVGIVGGMALKVYQTIRKAH